MFDCSLFSALYGDFELEGRDVVDWCCDRADYFVCISLALCEWAISALGFDICSGCMPAGTGLFAWLSTDPLNHG